MKKEITEKLLRGAIRENNKLVYKDIFDKYWTDAAGVEYVNEGIREDSVALRADIRDDKGEMLYCSAHVVDFGMSSGGDRVVARILETQENPQVFDSPLYFHKGAVCVDLKDQRFEISIDPFEVYLEKTEEAILPSGDTDGDLLYPGGGRLTQPERYEKEYVGIFPAIEMDSEDRILKNDDENSINPKWRAKKDIKRNND